MPICSALENAQPASIRKLSTRPVIKHSSRAMRPVKQRHPCALCGPRSEVYLMLGTLLVLDALLAAAAGLPEVDLGGHRAPG